MNKELGHDVLHVFPGDSRVSGKVSDFPQFEKKDAHQLVDVEHKANGLRTPSLCERWCMLCVCVCVCVSVSFRVSLSVNSALRKAESSQESPASASIP